MIKVLDHGARTRIQNPITKQWSEMINVRFVEEGRSGGNAQMSESTAFLDSLVGEQTGLENLRVHTHPVKVEKIELFPVGKTYPGYINRNMYSQPQIKQQEGVRGRMIDGKLTFFTTYLSNAPKDDRDLRLSISDTLAIDRNGLREAQLGATIVQVLEMPHPVEELQVQGAGGGTEELGE